MFGGVWGTRKIKNIRTSEYQNIRTSEPKRHWKARHNAIFPCFPLPRVNRLLKHQTNRRQPGALFFNSVCPIHDLRISVQALRIRTHRMLCSVKPLLYKYEPFLNTAGTSSGLEKEKKNTTQRSIDPRKETCIPCIIIDCAFRDVSQSGTPYEQGGKGEGTDETGRLVAAQ